MQMMGHVTNVLQKKVTQVAIEWRKKLQRMFLIIFPSLIYIVMLLQACLECPDFP